MARTRRRPVEGRYRDITVSLTQAQYTYLKVEADARTTSISQLIRELLQESLPPLPDVVTKE